MSLAKNFTHGVSAKLYVEYLSKEKEKFQKRKRKGEVRDMSQVKFNIAIVQINSPVNLSCISK